MSLTGHVPYIPAAGSVCGGERMNTGMLCKPKVAIVGRGRVANHLCRAFSGVVEVTQVNPHSPEEAPSDSDFVVIAVSDSAIAEVAKGLQATDAVVAHTSGSVPMDVLAAPGRRCGVLYPLQTFSEGRELDYSAIPFFTEGDSEVTLVAIDRLAGLVSDSVYHGDSALRGRLHLAAVFACNFTNALYGVADELLRRDGLDIKVMLPLIEETVGKLRELSPCKAQTGPASRRDTGVIERQMEALKEHPDLQRIYGELTGLIIHDS